MPEIEYPITVNAIEYKESPSWERKLMFGGECGDFVAVRPCGDEYGKKTYLGILLGGLPLSIGCHFKSESGTMVISRWMYNPAIFIPDLNDIVFGVESWWGKIESPEQLQEITDATIDNVWYVKALKSLEATQADGEAA